MRNRLFIGLLAGFVGLVTLTARGAEPAITISVVTTFDYPGAGVSTFPFGINNGGDIAGYFVDAGGVTRGFMRARTGVLGRPIVEPNDTAGLTRALGINSAKTIAGDFFNLGDNSYHGYFLSGRTFTQFDFGGIVSTDVFGINDTGNFAGDFGSTTQPNQPFVNIGGTSMVVSIPGAVDGSAHGISNFDQVVGSYDDNAAIMHGFLRASNGSLTAPLDYPGATSPSSKASAIEG